MSQPNLNGVRYDLAGSASVIHKDTGLNLTGGMGYRDAEDSNPVFFYVKPGWRASFFDFGRTSFSVDYQRTLNFAGNSNPANPANEGNSIGAVVAQNLVGYGIDIYGGFRWYSLEQHNGANFDDIYVYTVGTRIKF